MYGDDIVPDILPYNRQKAVSYADKWALSRNPRYLDFSNFGGDCTNFISQCLYAGSGIMNYTPTFGWFYISPGKRTASWTGVKYLYKFLTTNKVAGVFAKEVEISEMELGDVIQLGDDTGRFYHSLLVTKIIGEPSLESIYISTHTIDSHNRQLSTYIFDRIRFLHIEGVYNTY